MARVQNPFVDYLNRYTTASPNHEAAFDEYIAAAQPPAAGPLRLQTKIERFLLEVYNKDRPPSVILTGNAGDGKTYLCRQVLRTFGSPQVSDLLWESLVDRPIERNGTRLFVVKDLSELSEEKGKEILDRLGEGLNNPANPNRYLIAANEGRLRQLLSGLPHRGELSQTINHQLENGAEITNESLIVINLNRVATSTFVPETLRWMTDPRHWHDCQQCHARDKCPIRYNAEQLANNEIVSRVQTLYQLLEAIGEHLTVRDMLIHFAYTISGGQTCRKIQQAGSDLSQFVYYENIFGRADDEGFRRKSHLTQLLARLQIGQHSSFEIDEFILSGGKTSDETFIHQKLFGETIDVNFKQFNQDRRAYLEGSDNSRAQDALKWLPHCRRKIFFTGSIHHYYRLLPFRFFQEYHQLYRSSGERIDEQTLRLFVKGLNRAFSRLYLHEDQHLYITAQYLHSVNQPHPLVLFRIPIDNIRLFFDETAADYIDVTRYTLCLDISPPRTSQNQEPLKWRLGILQFEYIMRLAVGGNFAILATECELDIRRLKDELIKRFAPTTLDQHVVEFFMPARSRYELRRLRINEHRKIVAE
ncbi:hypothetical protein [Chloroflexus sp.]|uniref:hypothetical protein n=1 Tax=Chloroflexus sp. TaxID=1904827 RepID=UPI0026216C16|nr:hypothetical protein [uncultured Chloroflexus sp.]